MLRILSTISSGGIRTSLLTAKRPLSGATSKNLPQSLMNKTPSSFSNNKLPNLTALKLDSNASKHLYAVFRIFNIPFLVTKGDKVVLPFKLKNAEAGDHLKLNNVTTIGSPTLTYNDNEGIDERLYVLNANVIEITREPYYEVYRKKQRCRRKKTFPVQNHQTILRVNELKLI